jgi:sec-independent protein translocase protein TatA
MVPNIGPMEIVVVLIIALIVLGPKKLPELARSVGRGMREFKNAVSMDSGDDEDDEREERRRRREREQVGSGS